MFSTYIVHANLPRIGSPSGFPTPGDLLKPFQVAPGKGGPPATPDVASHVRQLFAI